MKKLLFAALAFAAVACSKSEVIEQTAPVAISFEKPFVSNTTKSVVDPSTTSLETDGFTVYGFMDDPDGIVFNAEKVTYSDNAYKTTTTQYWTAEHDYYFAAVAGDNWSLDVANASTSGAGKISFTNENGTDDLLYAATKVTTKNIGKITESNPGTVGLQFNHLLSKVKFAFTNGFSNPNTSIIVKDVTLSVPGKGTLDLAAGNWWEGDKWSVDAANDLTLKFGDIVVDAADMDGDNVYPAVYYTDKGESVPTAESYNELLTIPTAYRTYTITFTTELYQGEVLAGTYNHTVDVEGIRFQMGYAYKFTAELNGTNIDPNNEMIPITFSVSSIKGWEDGGIYDGGELDTNPTTGNN